MSEVGKITFTPLGGGQEIGANSYLLGLDGHRILLDCGVHPKKEGVEALPDFSLLDRPPDAVFISHGHVDHCGGLPRLLKLFPNTTSYATAATVRIMDRMLHNSVAVMKILVQERGIRDYPLYSHDDVDQAIDQTVGMPYDEPFVLQEAGETSSTLHHAGHVLGGASVLLRAQGHTLFYTGDICAADQELLSGRTVLDPSVGIDTLVIESTYGADAEADESRYDEEIARFSKGVTAVLERGGVALVPSFALGRTQEVLNIIARLQETGRIPEAPVLSSGLGRAIYEVYRRFPDYLRSDANLRPLRQFGRVGDVWNVKKVRALLRRPAIIVATSGMMVENTPSALIAQEMVRDPRHGIFFVGYLDPDSLGFRLLNAQPGVALRFQLGKSPVGVALEDIQWFCFSAHAPRQALRDIVNRLQPRKNVVFVHGDQEAVGWMYDNAGNGCRRFAPATGETVTLGD